MPRLSDRQWSRPQDSVMGARPGRDWDEAGCLVVPPGWRVKATYDDGIIDKEPVS